MCGGRACIAGTRLPVWGLVDAWKQGRSDAYLLANYPALTRTKLKAARDYYAAHKGEIDRDLADQE